jgi:hypothetical protein
MNCNTKIISSDGTESWKYKAVFNTLDEAIAEAKKRNASIRQTIKLVGYKCTYCHKYHIGRNGKRLTEKEKEKYRKELGIGLKILGKINLEPNQSTSNLKVVGWIDLDKIKY